MPVKGEYIEESTHFWTFRTICPYCQQPAEVKGLRKRALDRWNKGFGVLIQDTFPHLPADEREILLSGMHGACFDKAFPPDEDEGFNIID